MMIAVSTLYAISQLPRHIIFLYGTVVNWGTRELAIVWNLAVLLSSSASCYNPVIYAWMNVTYRHGLTRVLRLIFCCAEDKNKLPAPKRHLRTPHDYTGGEETQNQRNITQ